MNVRFSGQLQVSRFQRCLNDLIITPSQILIEKESNFLKSENDELKRNNEDLSNRIEQMFQEFDLISGSSKNMHNNYANFIKNDKKLNKDLGKVHKTHHTSNSQTTDHRKNRKSQSYDTTDAGTLPGIQLEDKATQLNIKNKMLEKRHYVKHFNTGLDVSLFQDKSAKLQLRNNQSHITNRSSSPVYIEIFDNPYQAIKFKTAKEKHAELNTQKKKSLVSKIYSKIPVLDELIKLHEVESVSNNHFSQNSYTKNSDQRINLSEENEQLVKQNENFDKIKDLNGDFIRKSAMSSTNNSKTCQTSFENGKQTTNFDQSVNYMNESTQILQKIDEQNNKIENLSETLSLILNKTDYIKTMSTNNKDSFIKLELNSLLNKDLNHSTDSNITKYSKSLDFTVNNRCDKNKIKENCNYKSIACSFSDLDKTDNRTISKKKLNETQNEPSKEKSHLCENINKENKNKETENINTFISLLNDEKVITINEALKLSQDRPITKSDKIPKRFIKNKNGKFQTTSQDNFEILFSNDLESSYETLYDPILSARSLINEENITYL